MTKTKDEMAKDRGSRGAFPEEWMQAPGLSIREYMATQIMAGFCARGRVLSHEDRARIAVRQADVLLRALQE